MSKHLPWVLAAIFIAAPVYGQSAAVPIGKPISTETKLLIKEAQHLQDGVNVAYTNIQQAVAQAIAQQKLQQRSDDAAAKLQAAEDKAYTEAGLDKTKYDFDPDTYVFTEKPKPAADTKTPDAHKPAVPADNGTNKESK